MAKSVSKSAYSAGAREERAVVRRYLRRQLRDEVTPSLRIALNDTLTWVLGRSKRFDKRKGGL